MSLSKHSEKRQSKEARRRERREEGNTGLQRLGRFLFDKESYRETKAEWKKGRENNKNKKSKTSRKKKSEMGKKEWIKATSGSPAARGGFSDKERWELQKKHREWKAKRKAGTHRKKNLTNAEKIRLRRSK